jgi:RNA polymerase-binding transcription factor DksA
MYLLDGSSFLQQMIHRLEKKTYGICKSCAVKLGQHVWENESQQGHAGTRNEADLELRRSTERIEKMDIHTYPSLRSRITRAGTPATIA